MPLGLYRTGKDNENIILGSKSIVLDMYIFVLSKDYFIVSLTSFDKKRSTKGLFY
jgi:hypothetical protein